MTMLFALAFALALGYLLGRYRVHQLQHHGEAIVSAALAVSFHPPEYHLLNNVTLPLENGTTQIDHILISRYGVFVIETKHYKGWIFGNARSPIWTQVLFKRKYKFQNPLHQNYKHMKSVQSLLNFLAPEDVRPAVVFTGEAEFQTPRPDGVFTIKELIEYLRGHKDAVMSENRLQFCVGLLECHRLSLTRETDVTHRRNLQRRFGDAA